MNRAIAGGCHCGAIRFEATVPAAPQLLQCNCSICAFTGFLHLIVPHRDFTLVGGDDELSPYQFGSRQAVHLFCRHCGVKSFYQPRSHPDSWSVNYNCLDSGHGLEPGIISFDGRNWEAAKAGLDQSSAE